MHLKSGDSFRGLVNALGSAGASVGSTNSWSLVFHLAAWRKHEQVEVGELRCEMAVGKPELTEAMKRIDAYSIVDIRVADLTAKNVVVMSSVEIHAEEDTELTGIREALQIPVRLNSQDFGQLELDRRFGDYSGEVDWWGSHVTLTLTCADHELTEAVLASANTLFEAKEKWCAKIKQFAADQLLDLKNDNWLHEDEGEVSQAEFISCMTLTEVLIDESGDFTFYYDDGDLFWGHSISVSGNLKQGLLEAGI
jgi:hypothetical protein